MTEIKPDWLVEIAPHYYQMKDVEDGKCCFEFVVIILTEKIICACLWADGSKKMPRGQGRASGSNL